MTTNSNANDIHTIYMDVNPDQAIQWLEGNVRNRKIDQKWVDYLAVEMLAGRWKTTHQGLAFDRSDTLIDGQHRLWALIQSGCTIRVAVSHGLDSEDIDNIDDNKPRNKAMKRALQPRSGTPARPGANAEHADPVDLFAAVPYPKTHAESPWTGLWPRGHHRQRLSGLPLAGLAHH